MVKVTLIVEENGVVREKDWTEFDLEAWIVFNQKLKGWGSANFILRLVDKMVLMNEGMDVLTPQAYADEARNEIDNPRR